MSLGNSNKHKAHYQLTRFIGSPEYYSYDLTPDDIAILFIISRYLDMPRGTCFVKQVNFAAECRMSERHFRERTKILAHLKLIFRYTRGKLYHYEFGEVITGIEQ